MVDTIRCRNKEDVKQVGDSIGWKYIEEWIFEPGGAVVLYTNVAIIDLCKGEVE